MWLVVGLGNPGSKYAQNRHNIGFMMIDHYVSSVGHPPEKQEHKSLTYHVQLTDTKLNKKEKVILCKPQTFMNLSGDAVRGLCDFYKIPLSQVIVAHDDKDLHLAQLKIQHNRGHGGQNGIRDIHQKMSSKEYYRFKMGVGHPPPHFETGDWVLSNFKSEEVNQLGGFLSHCCEAMESLIFRGYQKTSTEYNLMKKPEIKN